MSLPDKKMALLTIISLAISILAIILAVGFWLWKPQEVSEFFASINVNFTFYLLTMALTVTSLLWAIVSQYRKNKLQKQVWSLETENQELANPAKKIIKDFNNYRLSDLGEKFIRDNKVSTDLVGETNLSMEKIINNQTSEVVEEDIYYLYLFSLLTGVESRIWAISMMGEAEYIDTPKETEFLRLNLEVTKRKLNPVRVERIFLVTQEKAKEIKNNRNIMTLIDSETTYLKTFIAFYDEVPQELIFKVGEGILGFDDYVVTKDDFDDHEKIRGHLYFDKKTIQQCDRTYHEIKDRYATLLTRQYALSL